MSDPLEALLVNVDKTPERRTKIAIDKARGLNDAARHELYQAVAEALIAARAAGYAEFREQAVAVCKARAEEYRQVRSPADIAKGMEASACADAIAALSPHAAREAPDGTEGAGRRGG